MVATVWCLLFNPAVATPVIIHQPLQPPPRIPGFSLAYLKNDFRYLWMQSFRWKLFLLTSLVRDITGLLSSMASQAWVCVWDCDVSLT